MKLVISTMQCVIQDTKLAIWNPLQPRYMLIPPTGDRMNILKFDIECHMSNFVWGIEGNYCLQTLSRALMVNTVS
jgi:hypothetical protein